MQREITHWALLSLSLGGPALAQARIVAPNTAPPVAPSAVQAEVARPGRLPARAPTLFNKFMGGAEAHALTLDDEVPGAKSAAGESGAAGPTPTTASSPLYLGFAGGKYFPGEAERIDPQLLVAARSAQSRGANETYAFVMFDKRMTPERIGLLEALGLRVLQFHPGYCLKVAVPIVSIEAVASLDFVRWIGVARAWQKIHPALAASAAASRTNAPLDVYIDLFDSDLDVATSIDAVGAQSRTEAGALFEVTNGEATAAHVLHSHGPAQRVLELLGVEVIDYDEGIRAFRARVRPDLLSQVIEQDFVQFVELDAPRELAHDESTPMLGNDIVRFWYPGNTSGLVNIGQVDTGVDTTHSGLGLWVWGWDFTGGGSAFLDGCEHGSHVMGTILGSGAGSYGGSLKGVAPGLARNGIPSLAFVARIFDNACTAAATPLSTIFSVFENDLVLPGGTAPRPMAINNSWGAPGSYWYGTEAEARIVDDEVFNHDQLYVFAAGNEGASMGTVRLQATAKNALTVGAIVDFNDPSSGFPGSIASFSSRGPCGDNRWKPNVSAPGHSIRSVDANSFNGYKDMSGTSMAAPHVTGLAAEIGDAMGWLRYWPAGIASVLMSSAETKGDIRLTTPLDTHLRNYGTGKVEECKAILGSSDYFWNTWTLQTVWPNFYMVDFNVPAGTKRITVAMNYYEASASAGASQALINDWDLWIDDPINGLDPGANTGDYVIQQSAIDNCEIRTIDNPTIGTWRWKVHPFSVIPFSTVKMGVTVTFELNTPTCSPVFDVATPTQYLKPGQTTYIDANLTNYNGLASDAFFDSTSAGDTLTGSNGGLFDGSPTSYLGNSSGGRDVTVGDIPPFYGRSVEWLTSWATEGVKSFQVDAHIDNGGVLTDSVNITVDGTPPPAITGLHSFTHTVGVWSNSLPMYYAWNIPADNLSGVQGYAVAGTSGSAVDPGTVMTIGNVSTGTLFPPSSSQPYFITMRAVDNCNNWQTGYASDGPYYVDTVAPGGPTNLQSTSHNLGSSCDATVDLIWSAATDADSGIAGYSIVWDNSPSTVASGPLTIAGGATSTTSPALGVGTWYCHLRAQDNANNSGTTVHQGPFHIYPTGIIASYCTPKTNSLGCVPNLTSSGTPSASAASGFTLQCSNVRNQKPGLVIYSITGQNSVPFQGGFLCVLAPVRRTSSFSSGGTAPGNNDCTGVYSIDFNAFARGSLGGAPAPELSVAGTVVDAQFWGRDPGFPAPNNSALSRGIEFVMCN